MVDREPGARNVGGLAFASIIAKEIIARNAEEPQFASIIVSEVNAKFATYMAILLRN